MQKYQLPYTPPVTPVCEPAEFIAPSTHKSVSAKSQDTEGRQEKKEKQEKKERDEISITNFYKHLSPVSAAVLTCTPILAIYGSRTTQLQFPTFVFAFIYYFITGLGVTAGYHRLFAHRSFNASPALRVLLLLAGAGAFQGSARWWCRGHRAHHRYTDTAQDPYAVHEGLFHAHFGWMIFTPRVKPGRADTSDLLADPLVSLQHQYYVPLALFFAFVFPAIFCGLVWGDWRGGFYYAGVARCVFLHHATFCVNSLAHYLGDAPFDDKHSPRDHFVTALVTFGEGYHNFHHEFPQDYRNAIKWYQYDPTKVFIYLCSLVGSATHLKRSPDNEIRKGRYVQTLKRIERERSEINWPRPREDLPVLSFDSFLAEAQTKPLVLIAGFIHDLSGFETRHPGGAGFIRNAVGRDMTGAFHGGVYDHSNAAHNMLDMMRVGVLSGGMEVVALRS